MKFLPRVPFFLSICNEWANQHYQRYLRKIDQGLLFRCLLLFIFSTRRIVRSVQDTAPTLKLKIPYFLVERSRKYFIFLYVAPPTLLQKWSLYLFPSRGKMWPITAYPHFQPIFWAHWICPSSSSFPCYHSLFKSTSPNTHLITTNGISLLVVLFNNQKAQTQKPRHPHSFLVYSGNYPQVIWRYSSTWGCFFIVKANYEKEYSWPYIIRQSGKNSSRWVYILLYFRHFIGTDFLDLLFLPHLFAFFLISPVSQHVCEFVLLLLVAQVGIFILYLKHTCGFLTHFAALDARFYLVILLVYPPLLLVRSFFLMINSFLFTCVYPLS